MMSTVWHSKYALSANVIHSLIKPLQKEDIFSATCCELSAQTCRNAAVAAAAASSPQKRREGAAGREMASTGIIYFADEYLEAPAHRSFPVPPFQRGRQQELGASQLPGSQVCWKNIPAVLVGTHLSFPGCSDKHI